MSITELMPILHTLTHVEKFQIIQVLLKEIASEENLDIEIPKTLQTRPIGLLKNSFSVPKSFFEPLPNELLDAFEGHG
jgi:hypothetical protein